MISATQAKLRSEAVRKENQLKEVEKKIEGAIAKGEFSINMIYLSDATIEELKSLGYEVRFFPGDYMTNDEYDVSW